MKKSLMIVLAILISVAFVTTVIAQEKKAEKPAGSTEKPAVATDKPAQEKAPAKKFTGEFVSMDEATKTVLVKGETEMAFDVSKVKKMAKFSAGDKVNVVYKEQDGKKWATTITKAAVAKAKKVEKPVEPALTTPTPTPIKK